MLTLDEQGSHIPAVDNLKWELLLWAELGEGIIREHVARGH